MRWSNCVGPGITQIGTLQIRSALRIWPQWQRSLNIIFTVSSLPLTAERQRRTWPNAGSNEHRIFFDQRISALQRSASRWDSAASVLSAVALRRSSVKLQARISVATEGGRLEYRTATSS
jgi:hypothetical protein